MCEVGFIVRTLPEYDCCPTELLKCIFSIPDPEHYDRYKVKRMTSLSVELKVSLLSGEGSGIYS
jgi:hypothetical protein